jgi:hypothetical protein
MVFYIMRTQRSLDNADRVSLTASDAYVMLTNPYCDYC